MINWEENSPYVTLTHLDGRNATKLKVLRSYFSELAWDQRRLDVMIAYSTALATKLGKQKPAKVSLKLTLADMDEIKKIEKRTNHDVKALEEFLDLRHRKLAPYINLGIGSEDINSIAFGIQILESRGEVLLPQLELVLKALSILADTEKNTVMIGRTHASPSNVTTFGKEIANSLSRLCDEIEFFVSLQLSAKCSGEVGTYQAFMGVDTSFDWVRFTDTFIQSFGLKPSHAATQIAPYDSLVTFLHSLFRINTILLGFSKNMWLYVLLGYLKVKKIESEVGSAGMPHKVNPIFFEGAEGGLIMANGIIETLARSLPVNRLSRDFSDSTLRRNIALVFAYSLLSYQSLETALGRISVDHQGIERDLERHAEVWIETVKAYGIAHGIPNMYDMLKKETRGKVLSKGTLEALINSLPLSPEQKKQLRTICSGKVNTIPARIVTEIVKRTHRLLS